MTLAGSIRAGGEVRSVYAFTDGDQRCFALVGPLSFLPMEGMAVSDLQDQFDGAAAIAALDPVTLAESLPSDPRVPPARARGEAIRALALAQELPPDATVREGIFLRRTSEYLALVEAGDAWVVGSSLPATLAPFPRASPWRRLAVVVGRAWRAPPASRLS